MKKAMKVSVKGKKWQGFKGTRVKSSGGLKKADLIKNKRGKVVSKKQSQAAKARFAATCGKWLAAVTKARKALKVTGFQAVGGNSQKGQLLLKQARSFYKK